MNNSKVGILSAIILAAVSSSALASSFQYKHQITGLSSAVSVADADSEQVAPEPEFLTEPIVLSLDPVTGDDYISRWDRENSQIKLTGKISGGFEEGQLVYWQATSGPIMDSTPVDENGRFEFTVRTHQLLNSYWSKLGFYVMQEKEEGGYNYYRGYHEISFEEVPTISLAANSGLSKENYIASSYIDMTRSTVEYPARSAFNGYLDVDPNAVGNLFKMTDEGTTWKSNYGELVDQWVGVDFGRQRSIQGVGIGVNKQAKNSAKDVRIQISNDKQSWTTVGGLDTTVAPNGLDSLGRRELFFNSPISARFVRVFVDTTVGDVAQSQQPYAEFVYINAISVYGS